MHNDASHDGRCERCLTVAHSILAGAVAPHQDAQEAFGIAATRHGAETRCLWAPPLLDALNWHFEIGPTSFGPYIMRGVQLRCPSTFCMSENGRMLHGVPTQEPAIFRTQKQLYQKCQQVVRSIGYASGASGCSGLARSLFTFSKHLQNDTCSGGPSA